MYLHNRFHDNCSSFLAYSVEGHGCTGSEGEGSGCKLIIFDGCNVYIDIRALITVLDTTPEGSFNAFLDCCKDFFRNLSCLGRYMECIACLRRIGLHCHGKLCNVLFVCNSPIPFFSAIILFLDAFSVAYLWVTHSGFNLHFLCNSCYKNIQMKFTHTANNKLPSFIIFFISKGRIFN